MAVEVDPPDKQFSRPPFVTSENLFLEDFDRSHPTSMRNRGVLILQNVLDLDTKDDAEALFSVVETEFDSGIRGKLDFWRAAIPVAQSRNILDKLKFDTFARDFVDWYKARFFISVPSSVI